MRIGHGYDVHRLVAGRKLILGGVEVPHSLGLLGHSDADVLLHAIMDALLGAAALGDIGHLFPDTDPAYEGISSVLLLKTVGERISGAGYAISNIDATVIAQKPKLAPYIPAMRKVVAETLGIQEGQVNLMVFAIYLIACFAGGLAAGKGIRKRRFFWGFLLGLLYFLVLFAVSWALNQGGPVDLERSATVLGLCVLGGSLGGMVS